MAKVTAYFFYKIRLNKEPAWHELQIHTNGKNWGRIFPTYHSSFEKDPKHLINNAMSAYQPYKRAHKFNNVKHKNIKKT